MSSNSNENGNPLQQDILALQRRLDELERYGKARDDTNDALLALIEDHRKFSRQLATLVEITNELAVADSVHNMCRYAVELARARLGFDRIGIWFVGDELDIVLGSYGVNEQGELIDERDKRTRVVLNSPEGSVLFSKEPLVVIGDVSTNEVAGQKHKVGEQAFAAIWDGNNVIGHISMDNYVSKQPINEHQCELLRLLGSAIGYLYARKKAQDERQQTIQELQKALQEIKTLHGLIPICASCKKIRDDQGYWNQIEKYISERSEAEFSHSICPECTKKLYPDLADELNKKQDQP